MAEPPHKRARIAPPEGFMKSKPKQPVARTPAVFQSDFAQAVTTRNDVVCDTEVLMEKVLNTRPAPKPSSTAKVKDTPVKAPQPLRAPDFGQKTTPHTPPADLTSRARAFKLAEASGSGSGSSSATKTISTTKANVRSPLDPVLRRGPKAQTPHLHLDSPLTPIGVTPRIASLAGPRKVLAPPAPPRPTSPTPQHTLVPQRLPETPARKPMSHKTASAAKLLASMRKNIPPTPAAPLPGPPPLPVSAPPPPMQPLNTIQQLRPSSPEKEQVNGVSINATRIARATDLTTAGGSAELFGVMLGASGRELRSAGDRELARGLEITPTKPKSRRSGPAKGDEREKLGARARDIYQTRRLKRTLEKHAKLEELGPPKAVWKVLKVLHPSHVTSGVDKSFLSGGRENEGNAVIVHCVKDGGKAEAADEANVLLSACATQVAIGSLVRVWAPVVVIESERGKVLLCERYSVDEAGVE